MNEVYYDLTYVGKGGAMMQRKLMADHMEVSADGTLRLYSTSTKNPNRSSQLVAAVSPRNYVSCVRIGE